MTRRIATVLLLTLLTIGAMAGCNEDAAKREVEQQNMALVRRIHQEMAAGNMDIFIEALLPEYVRHCQAMPPEFQEMHGPEPLQAFVADFMGSVSDFNETIDLMFATGDKVAYVTTMTGVQSGPMGELPASNKPFTVVNIIIHRFESGKIAETWVSWDNMAMLTQLGFFPPPAEG